MAIATFHRGKILASQLSRRIASSVSIEILTTSLKAKVAAKRHRYSKEWIEFFEQDFGLKYILKNNTFQFFLYYTNPKKI
tara:strand:+ start:1845 stop:2084 length:240 start_codon:yes stop_codon:yes gene_type:complete